MNNLTPLITDQQIDKAINHAIITHKGINLIYRGNTGKDESILQFSKRFGQQVKLAFRDPELSRAIISIRERLKIPINGFDLTDADKFINWAREQEKNKYSGATDIISKYPIINSDLSALLEEILFYEDIEKYKLGTINNYYATRGCYDNHITEKPFTGIGEFILFNKLMVPLTNGIATIYNYSDDSINLLMSANTTKRDLLDMWSEINQEQKKMVNYNKSKNRISTKLDKELENFDNIAAIEKTAKEKGKSETETRLLKNAETEDLIETQYGEGITHKKRKKILSNIRQKRFRIKKKINTNK